MSSYASHPTCQAQNGLHSLRQFYCLTCSKGPPICGIEPRSKTRRVPARPALVLLLREFGCLLQYDAQRCLRPHDSLPVYTACRHTHTHASTKQDPSCPARPQRRRRLIADPCAATVFAGLRVTRHFVFYSSSVGVYRAGAGDSKAPKLNRIDKGGISHNSL